MNEIFEKVMRGTLNAKEATEILLLDQELNKEKQMKEINIINYQINNEGLEIEYNYKHLINKNIIKAEFDRQEMETLLYQYDIIENLSDEGDVQLKDLVVTENNNGTINEKFIYVFQKIEDLKLKNWQLEKFIHYNIKSVNFLDSLKKLNY
jgi:hypothetical protein